MSKQPKALRLADALLPTLLPDWVTTIQPPWCPPREACTQAAAELRRLHSVNADLLEALKTLLSVAHQEFDGVPGFGGEPTDTPGNRAISIARAAIAKAEET